MPKILYWDIENSPKLAATFETYDTSIHHSMIYQDTFVISAQWKWDGGEVQSITSKGKDDTRVIKKLCGLLSTADYAVAHNGDRHDWPVVLGRIMALKLPPIAEPVFIDTLKMARKIKVASRSLEYLAKSFDLPLKKKTSGHLWLNAARDGCQKSINEICDYGKGDIDNLEQLFNLMKPYVPTKFNQGLYTDRPCCPSCASENMQSRGVKATKTSKYQRWQCQDCGAWSNTTPRIKKAFFK